MNESRDCWRGWKRHNYTLSLSLSLAVIRHGNVKVKGVQVTEERNLGRAGNERVAMSSILKVEWQPSHYLNASVREEREREQVSTVIIAAN